MQHIGTIPARVGSAQLICDFKAISVQLQLQLPTGTELGNNHIPEYKCRICQKKVNAKYELMKHRISDHVETVPVCRDSANGTCSFGTQTCWSRHDNENVNDIETIEEIAI